MNQFFDPGGWFNPRYRHVSYDVTYKFPIKVEAGDVLEVHGERHIAFAKTKFTPIELSHCRSCSLFRKPICSLLKCENIRFEKVPIRIK